MPRVLVALALTALPATALAVSEAWFHDGAGEVEISGAVEVPLYRGASTEALPAVLVEVPAPEADVGDEPGLPTRVFAVVDLTGDWSMASEGVVKALGGKIKSTKRHGTATKIATIPEIHIGDVVIRDLRVEIDKEYSGLWLGMSTLDIGTAILPSQGVVKLVPASEAAALVSSVGTPMEVQWIEGKWWELGHKVYGDGLSGLVDGSALGTEGKVRIATGRFTSEFSGRPQPEDTRIQDATVWAWGAPEIPGVSLPETWMERNEALVDPWGYQVARIGYDVLYTVDIAVDPTAPTVAMSDATDVKWTPTRDIELEEARQAYAEATKVEEDEGDAAAEAEAETSEEDAGGPDKGDAKVVGDETSFASALWGLGLRDEALEHFKAAAEAGGDNCEPQQTYGRFLMEAGRAEEAKPHLEKAGELWDRWYAQDLDTREKVDKGKTAGIDFPLKQATVCHEAWGDLALAHLAMGDDEDVAKLYADKVDLDPTLPRAYGLSLVKQGKTDKANGPLRRAMNMGVFAGPSDHVALAAAHASADKRVVYDRQVERVQHFDAANLIHLMALVEAARDAEGDARADEVVDGMVERDPHSLQVQLMRALNLRRSARKAEARAELKQLLPELGEMIEEYNDAHANGTWAQDYYAIYQGVSGDPDGGLERLEQTAQLSHRSYLYWPARSMLLQLAGDMTGAEEIKRDFAMSHPGHPTAALGLITDFSGSGPRIKLQADKIELLENVLFVSGTAQIIEDSWPLLDEVKELLLEHPEILKVQVGGHTDDQGNDRANMKLSDDRAAAVLAYLTEHGIKAERLESKGYGETVPVADNGTAEGRQQNRRVEFTILQKK